MNYIVLDMEWNQTHSQTKVERRGVILRGEVIQIGAVKMNSDFVVEDSIKLNIAPVFYKRIHNRVKALTGINNAQMRSGVPFLQAFEQFMQWCGKDFLIITWGCDDIPMLRDNMVIHGIDANRLPKWYNLQVIYNAEVSGNGQQRALQTAMEQLGLENELQAHDALNDAINTARICGKLNTGKWIEEYEQAQLMMSGGKKPVENSSRSTITGFETRREANSAAVVHTVLCPCCGKVMECARWQRVNTDRKITLARCKTHGDFFVRLRFKSGAQGWSVVRNVEPADSRCKNLYSSRCAIRRGKTRKTVPAVKVKEENKFEG